MSVISAREVARRMKEKRAGLGFLHTRRKSKIAGMQDPSLCHAATSRVMTPATQLANRTTVEVQNDPSTDRTWCEPTAGLALRKTLHKSAATARGWEFFNNTIVYFESELEHRNLMRLIIRNDVAEIHSQALLFNYHDETGKLRNHIIDYLIIYKDGLKQAIVVKPERKRGEMLDLIKRIKLHPSSRQADDFLFLSEIHGTIEAHENAEFVLWSREHHDAARVAELMKIVSKMNGYFRFGELLRNCDCIGERRVAVWNLIDLGILFSPTGERITELTYLARNPAQ